MIIACPACATRYVVPDSAIGVEGRTVRCAKCRHSWFQDGPDVAVPPPAIAAPAPTQNPPPAPVVEQVASQPVQAEDTVPDRQPDARPGFSAFAQEAPEPDPVFRPAPVAPPVIPPSTEEEEMAPPLAEPIGGEQAVPPPPVVDDAELPSQFDREPPFKPRRNVLRLWTYAAAIFAAFAVGATVAVSYWGLPDWVPIRQPLFGLAQDDLVLDFPADRQDRRQLPNGTEYFGASGTVTNVGKQARNLPPILIVLRDNKDRIVYDWEIAPPKRTLAPGETVSIDEALLDVPKAAKVADIGWKPN